MCIRRLTPAGRLALSETLCEIGQLSGRRTSTSASAACEINQCLSRSLREKNVSRSPHDTNRQRGPIAIPGQATWSDIAGQVGNFPDASPMPSSSTIDSELPKLPMIVAMARRRPSGDHAAMPLLIRTSSAGPRREPTVGADEFQHRTCRTTARLDVRDDISLRRPGRRRRGARRGQRRGTTIRQRKNRQSRRVACAESSTRDADRRATS